MIGDVVLHDVTAVLPERVVEEATVTVADGLIVAIEARVPRPQGAIDGNGLLCLPGLIDTHSDGLEKELQPRPGVRLDADFALRSFEGRVRSAGITTVFHGIGFENDDRHERSVELAEQLCTTIERRVDDDHVVIDHRLLHRLDARDGDGFDALVERLARWTDRHHLPLVSFEDHTPGQGQYMDRTHMERYLAGTRKMSIDEAVQRVDEIIERREPMLVNRQRALEWLTERAAAGQIRLMAHDPATVDDVVEAESWSAAIAEFPTTIDAARAARERGMHIVCGAPNVVRGGSHSGNVSAAELVRLGLCDVLASDYLPSSLLGAVGALVRDRVCSLSEAVTLVTAGPADTVGFPDRGRLRLGCRGDLLLCRLDGWLPAVHAVFRAAHHPYVRHDEHAGTTKGATDERDLAGLR